MTSPFNHPSAALLIPVFALRRPTDFGIGDTFAMKDAITFCADQGFRVLQTLPIHETVGDHSPYNPVSSLALSAALLTMEADQVPGLTAEILKEHAGESWLAQLREGPVKHRLVQALKLKILLAAHHSFSETASDELRAEFAAFQEAERHWLPFFTLFRLLASEYENNPHWEQWRPEHQNPTAAEAWLLSSSEVDRLRTFRDGLAYIQWVAHRQWSEVRAFAEEKNILLMGEMSFGVSKSSADVWSRRELFDVEWSMGTRPVSYFDTNKDSERWGQNWGLPPYRWENHRSEEFAWVAQRMRQEAKYFHICRLDHLRGYFRAYMFPWQGGAQHSEFNALTDEEAKQRCNGREPRFVPGPDDNETTAQINALQGREIIGVTQKFADKMYLFAEIMGQMPDYMRQAIDDLEVPNLTFPLLEKDAAGKLLPYEAFRELSLISYGNHDHAAITAVYQTLVEKSASGDANASNDLHNLLTFAGWQGEPPPAMNDDLLAALQNALFQSPCVLAGLTITDLLGTPQRFNLPGSYGDQTWCERLELPLPAFLQHPVFGPRIRKASELLKSSGRLPDAAHALPSASPKKKQSPQKAKPKPTETAAAMNH